MSETLEWLVEGKLVLEGLTAAIAAEVRARMKREKICIVVCKSLEDVLY